jgi:hypothetical protein
MDTIATQTTLAARRGDWMPTYSGERFWPFDPRPGEVRIEDIAHHLAIINRFGGTSREPLSVAQHSVMVSEACAPADALWGLLHDAHEAYLGVDLPRPIKRQMRAWMEMERLIQDAICDCFGLPREMPGSVRTADEVLLATEARDISSNRQDIRTWTLREEPLPVRIKPCSWMNAERRFLDRFMELTRG